MAEPSKDLVPLRALLDLIPGPKRVHISTVLRWAIRGVRLRGGEQVKLEHVRVGGGALLSSEAALTKFLLATTAGHLAETPTPAAAPTPSASRRAAERSNKSLAEVLG